MRKMLLGFAASAAAVTIAPAPAQAERWSDPSFIAAASVAVHRGDGASSGKQGYTGHRRHREWSDGQRRRGHRDRNRDRSDDTIFLGDYGYYEDNPAWQPEGYNDWWHDRPSRSMPRWTQNNQNCERQYWTGGGWRC